MHHHASLQRRVWVAVASLLALALVIGVPLVVLDDERLEIALQLGLVPGKDAEQLTDSDDGAPLIVVPLDNGTAGGASPWLYRAQFIAWPNANGNELEHLDSHARVQIPLSSIEFSSSNGDGSLVFMRGPLAGTGEAAAVTVEPASMTVTRLPDADAVPSETEDWDVPFWEKTRGMCNRPSVEKRFIGCFNRADGASYLAGDWQLDLQVWGDFETVYPLYRGMGFLPWMGFAESDTVVYLQNELGIVRIDVPGDVLNEAPPSTPYATPTVLAPAGPGRGKVKRLPEMVAAAILTGHGVP